jgi:hypothetical protein
MLRDKWMERSKATPVLQLTAVLAVLIAQIGNHKFQEERDGQWHSLMTMEERAVVLDAMWLVNVQVAFFYVKMEDTGAMCSWRDPSDSFTISVDLSDAEIKCVDSVDETRRNVQFLAPQQIRGQTATGVVVGPPRWSAVSQIEADALSMSAHRAMFGALCSYIGMERPVQPVMADFDDLPRREVANIKTATGTIDVGLDVRVTYTNENGKEVETTVPWMRPGFFDPPSVSGTSVRSGRMTSR